MWKPPTLVVAEGFLDGTTPMSRFCHFPRAQSPAAFDGEGFYSGAQSGYRGLGGRIMAEVVVSLLEALTHRLRETESRHLQRKATNRTKCIGMQEMTFWQSAAALWYYVGCG